MTISTDITVHAYQDMMESTAITTLTNVHLTHVRTVARATTTSTAITVHAYKDMMESTAITT